jgi:hypothetical protein
VLSDSRTFLHGLRRTSSFQSEGGKVCKRARLAPYGPSRRRSLGRTDATARLLHQQRVNYRRGGMRPEQSLDLHDRHCRFSAFIELLNCHTLRDAGYCVAANAQHGHPSDRARTAKYSHAIIGDVSTVPTFAVRPGFLGIERGDRNAAICIAGISHELRTRTGPAARFWSCGDPARLGIAGVGDFGSLMARHPSDTGTYRWNR